MIPNVRVAVSGILKGRPTGFFSGFGVLAGGRPTGFFCFSKGLGLVAGGVQAVSGGAGPFFIAKYRSILNLNVRLCLRIRFHVDIHRYVTTTNVLPNPFDGSEVTPNFTNSGSAPTAREKSPTLVGADRVHNLYRTKWLKEIQDSSPCDKS